MDPESDALLHEQLFKYVENKALIVITHRLENIHQYDKIAVMASGEILEQGSYETLKQNKNSFFNKMINHEHK